MQRVRYRWLRVTAAVTIALVGLLLATMATVWAQGQGQGGNKGQAGNHTQSFQNR